MSISYHIYGNGGDGSPIDWSSPIATTASLSYTTGVLAASSHWRFGVRTFDTITGLEESSVDAQVAIILDASQADVTGLPPAPEGPSVVPLASGGYRVAWAWPFMPTPTGYKVYLGTPTVSYASPVATVPYTGIHQHHDGSGLTNGVTYQVVIRAYNAVGIEQNTVILTVTGSNAGPVNVDSLTATPTAQS